MRRWDMTDQTLGRTLLLRGAVVLALVAGSMGALAGPAGTLNSPFTFVSRLDKTAGGYKVNVKTSRTTTAWHLHPAAPGARRIDQHLAR